VTGGPELTPERRERDARQILQAAVDAADPAPLVSRAMQGAAELRGHGPVRILAIGKAAAGMARAAAALLDSRVSRTLVVAPAGTPAPDGTLFGGHPAPDRGSLAAGQAVLQHLRETAEGELVLVLLSGGASSCVAVPRGGISISDYGRCVMQLMHAGADVRELNMVRKQLDLLKGGGMARYAAPAPVLGLVLSDVVNDPLEVIASGPLTPEPSSCADALLVLQRHGLVPGAPPAVLEFLHSCDGGDGHPPPEDDPAFREVRVRVIGGNDVALEGAAAQAARLGYQVRRAPMPVTGLAREAGTTLAREALRLQGSESGPVCIVAGGETTVAVSGTGHGGRNQEIVLAAAMALQGAPGITTGSVGTDGVDGNSTAAGAVADETTLERAGAAGVDTRQVLEQNDSNAFFQATGGLVVTGPTGTNVNDVQVALIQALGPAVPRA
jgi:glycerate 2-kinase